MAKSLTLKEETFCRHFIEDGNATTAYRNAYDAHHLRPERAKESAYRVKCRPHVRQRIAELEAEIADRFLATQAERRALLWNVALANQHQKPDTSVKATAELNRMDPSLRAPALQVNADGPVRIELHPSLINRQLDRDDSAPTIERE